MKNSNLAIPSILVDLKKYRIRIHKNTLTSIGTPDIVLLMVNPEEQTLVILRSDCSEPRAHRITGTSQTKSNSIELYSRSLVRNLLGVCSNWQDNQTYRLYGEIFSNEGVARFQMDKSVLVSRAKS